VAVDGGKFVGTGRINLYDELPGVPVLNKLGVLSGYRGNGIAGKIVEARENWARSQGFKKVRTYVFGDRKKAIGFSEKNGYRITEIQKDGFKRKDGTTVDVMIMEKDL
jgi:GNAT superfamily N-acetyltransferase